MAAYNSAAVTNVIHGNKNNLLSTCRALSEDFETQYEQLSEAAAVAEQLRDTAQVQELRAMLGKLFDAHATLQWREQALQKLQHSYQCTATASNFEEVLRPPPSVPALANRDKRLREFDRAVWNVHHAGQPMPDEEGDDLWVDPTQGLAPNATCPISGKDLLSLNDPVKDQNGFVYERDAVVFYIGKHKDGSGSAECPVAGTTHRIRVSDLTTAASVLRAKKRKQHSTQQEREGEDVISL